MARFSQIAKGTRARKTFDFVHTSPTEGSPHNSVPVDVRPLSTAEEVEALSAARAYAVEQGLAEPKEGQPVYDLAVQAHVVRLACVDHESPADRPAPFFDTIEQVLSLDRDRLALLYEAQVAWQEQCSPRRTTLSPTEYAVLVYQLAEEETPGADPFFEKLPRATLVSLLRTMARQLVSSPQPRSDASSSPSASGASAAPSPDALPGEPAS